MDKRLKNYFQINGKRMLILFAMEVLAIFLHNAISAVLGLEEALFFILAVFVLPLFLLTSVFYSFWKAMSRVEDKKKSAKYAGIFILTAYGVLLSEITKSNLSVMFADVVSGFSVIGIALLLYPFLKPASKQLSKVYLYLKTAEGLIMIFGGLLYLIGLKDLRNTLYEGLHVYVFATSALIFYWLLYKSKLVPRFISVWGIIAILALGALTIAKTINIDASSLEPLLVLVITNEIFLAIWLIVKGVKKQ